MWPLKMITKLLLARTPLPRSVLRQWGVFRHGDMDSLSYAAKVFDSHIARAYPQGTPAGLTFLELGPGDSLLSMVLAKGLGAEQIWLVDHGDFAARDLTLYQHSAQIWRAEGRGVPDLSKTDTWDDLLTQCRATYVTHGLESLKKIPDSSVDFIYSHAVLEHIWRDDFAPLMREVRRILKPGGAASHVVDYQDHLDHALNHLRFPARVWESQAFRTSGFYTNRLLYQDMVAIFTESGFDTQTTAHETWSSLPTPRRSLSAPYQTRSDAELKTKSATFILRPGAGIKKERAA
ncbi:MAG: class I SAM-dependent methyltransferase [Alphaproteobacteria bacterium]|nr:class I SAM-dependent methyltransferase [Alphaproteobacteria bacterium]